MHARIQLSRSQFSKAIAFWRSSGHINQTTARKVVYSLLRGKQATSGFTPVSNRRKLRAGQATRQELRVIQTLANARSGLLERVVSDFFPGEDAETLGKIQGVLLDELQHNK